MTHADGRERLTPSPLIRSPAPTLALSPVRRRLHAPDAGLGAGSIHPTFVPAGPRRAMGKRRPGSTSPPGLKRRATDAISPGGAPDHMK